jgi:hypothetical protein
VRIRRQAPRNIHCAIESLAADRFVHQPFPFGFTRIQWLTHEDVHECSWRSDGARHPLRAAGTGKETKVCLRQPDQVVAILRNTKIARERELEAPARVVSETAAITGFGMLSYSAMALSKPTKNYL